ncbi:hypothetical protein [Streptomyces sp. NPDC101165]|uniref:hypothetical protein n=1 Tax=Streptomyces sp. NPDC101165 TaxID=3366119 RepID=UPI0038128833
MRAHHARAAKALAVQAELGGEFWGGLGALWGPRARTAAGASVWLRQVSARADKASGKLWDGAADAQCAFGDLDARRPALLGMWETTDDGTVYRADLSARVDQPVLSDAPILNGTGKSTIAQHEPPPSRRMVGRNENASGIPKLGHKPAEHANEREAPGQGLWTPAGVTGTHEMSHSRAARGRAWRSGTAAQRCDRRPAIEEQRTDGRRPRAVKNEVTARTTSPT